MSENDQQGINNVRAGHAAPALPIGRPSKRITLGRCGEDAAVAFYRARGARIVARNWRAGRFAEVDLIVEEPYGMMVFAEVKTRRRLHRGDDSFASGFASVDRRKQQKILTAARIYVSRNERLVEFPCRFDVLIISFAGHRRGNPGAEPDQARIIHIPDAFAQ